MEEQADLQQALELQSKRLMGLQLLNVKKHHLHRALSTGSPNPSPTQSSNMFHQNLVFPPLHSANTKAIQKNGSSPLPIITVAVVNIKESSSCEEGMNGNGKESSRDGKNDVLENLEHNLPDSPFAYYTKGIGEHFSAFSNTFSGTEKDILTSSANNNLVSPNLITANASLGFHLGMEL